MATFRIHEDQENIHAGELRRNHAKEVLQQKRNVLGQISSNNFEANQRLNNKQSLKVRNQENENYHPTKCVGKQQIPIVPVAQFEAFSVYEEKVEIKDKTLTQLDKKPTVTVSEAFKVFEEKGILKDIPLDDKHDMSCVSTEDSPMSIDKSLISNIENKPIEKRISIHRDLTYDTNEYRDDIYKYMRECESKHRPKPGYMRKQPDITYSMRTVLVDWLVEVAEEYKLQAETLFLAVSYIDRFLSYMSVVRAKLQLVGTAAMFIAAKYEEIYPPDVGEFVYITDDTYSKKQVLRMEHLILKVLSFDLSVPTPLTFVKDFCTTYEFDDKTTSLSLYLIELSLLEADPYLQLLPSTIACGAMALARYTLDEEPWTVGFEESTGYSLEYLRPCIAHLYNTYMKAEASEQQAIQEKYKHSKYHQVALILPKEPTEDFINLSLYTQPETQVTPAETS